MLMEIEREMYVYSLHYKVGYLLVHQVHNRQLQREQEWIKSNKSFNIVL